MAKTKSKEIPLGVLIDGLYEMRAERIELARKVDDMKGQERIRRTEILDRLKAQKAEKSSGKHATASRTVSTTYRAADWKKVYAHIKKTGDFDLLQQRLATTACDARFAAGKKVPGVEAFEIEDLSVSKSTRSA